MKAFLLVSILLVSSAFSAYAQVSCHALIVTSEETPSQSEILAQYRKLSRSVRNQITQGVALENIMMEKTLLADEIDHAIEFVKQKYSQLPDHANVKTAYMTTMIKIITRTPVSADKVLADLILARLESYEQKNEINYLEYLNTMTVLEWLASSDKSSDAFFDVQNTAKSIGKIKNGKVVWDISQPKIASGSFGARSILSFWKQSPGLIPVVSRHMANPSFFQSLWGKGIAIIGNEFKSSIDYDDTIDASSIQFSAHDWDHRNLLKLNTKNTIEFYKMFASLDREFARDNLSERQIDVLKTILFVVTHESIVIGIPFGSGLIHYPVTPKEVGRTLYFLDRKILRLESSKKEVPREFKDQDFSFEEIKWGLKYFSQISARDAFSWLRM